VTITPKGITMRVASMRLHGHTFLRTREAHERTQTFAACPQASCRPQRSVRIAARVRSAHQAMRTPSRASISEKSIAAAHDTCACALAAWATPAAPPARPAAAPARCAALRARERSQAEAGGVF
jgi:hypothetical protein